MWIFLTILGLLFLTVSLLPATRNMLPVSPNIPKFVGIVFLMFGLFSTSYVNIPNKSVGLKYKKFMGSPNLSGIISYNGENGRQADILPEGLNISPFINVIYDISDTPTVVIPDNMVGLLTSKDGLPLNDGEFIAPDWVKPGMEHKRDSIENAMLKAENFLKNGGRKGPQLNVLRPGEYKINRYLFDVDIVKATTVKPGYVGVIVSKVGDVPDDIQLKAEGGKLANPVVDKGYRGIWKQVLTPSTYYMNTRAYDVYMFDTRVQTWKYAGNYTTAEIDLTVDENGDIKQTRREIKVDYDKGAADHAMSTKTKDGWEVHVNCRLLVQIDASDAPYILSSIGDLQKLEDKVITPLVRSQVRNQGERVEATEFVTRRTDIEQEIEEVLIVEAVKSRVKVKEFRMTSVAIPPELLVPDKRKQLATKLKKTYDEEKKAFDAKVATAKAKAQAEQQPELVRAQIQRQAENENKEALRLKGQGERMYMEEIARGQKAMVSVYGADRSFKLKSMEEMGKLAEKSPEMFKAPEIYSVNGGNGNSGENSTTMGLSFMQMNKMLDHFSGTSNKIDTNAIINQYMKNSKKDSSQNGQQIPLKPKDN
jgi:regulator of protease activity HflC (stomatin/prohibitin superfamily)